MRKTALLTGVAGLFLMTAPAFAQDSTVPQTPSDQIPAAQTPAASETGQQPAGEAQSAQPQQLTLQPGAVVRGSDGAELGRLEGVRNGAAGQELTIRGSDGQLRAVSTTGIRQDGDAVVVGSSSGEFQSSPAITDGEAQEPQTNSPDPATPATPADPASTDNSTDSMAPTEPTTTTDPTTAAEPMVPAQTEPDASSDQPSEDDAGDTDASSDEPTGGDQPGA